MPSTIRQASTPQTTRVNIKILLGLPLTEGELTEKQRNALLPQMTDDVADLVLSHNYGQTQILSVTGRIAPQLLDAQQRLMQSLEGARRLDRAIEFLPNDEELAERRAKGEGLSGPQSSVLLAYSKIWLFDELVASTLPDDPWIATSLVRYFPQLMRDRFAQWMPQHPLRREIIATYVTNGMTHRVGSTFVHRIAESTGAEPEEIVRAYLLAREVFGLLPIWREIDALDNTVADAVQAQMLVEASQHLERGTNWFLRSPRLPEPMPETIEALRTAVETVQSRLLDWLSPDERQRAELEQAELTDKGVPQALAQRMSTLPMLPAVLDIVEVAAPTNQPLELAAAVYFELAGHLGIGWLSEKISALPGTQHWQMLAKGSMLDDLSGLQRATTATVLSSGLAAPGTARSASGETSGSASSEAAGSGSGATSAAQLVARWSESNNRVLHRARQLLNELRSVAEPDSAMLSVMLREMRRLG